MNGSRLSLTNKLSLAAFAGLVLVGVIVLIYPELASDHTPKCTPTSEALQGITPASSPAALPELVFSDAEGSKVSLSAYRGKGVILNFWATWCVPCIHELPELDTIRNELAADNIDVLAVSTDRGGIPVIREFYGKTGIRNLDILHDPKAAMSRALGIRGLPTTLLINAEGREVARILGIHKYESEESKAFFRRCLGEG